MPSNYHCGLDYVKRGVTLCHTIMVMARKRKRGRPFGGEKGSVLSVRVSPETRRQLETAARKNQRSLSREVEGRLNFSFGRYGTGRPTHIADLAELVALLAQSIERRTRGEWDRNRATREWLIRAFTDLVDLYSKAEVTFHRPSVSLPSKLPSNRDDLATHAVSDVIISLLHSIPPPGWEPEIWSPGGSVRWNILRNLERRRRKK
jgi:hypothetical protein